MTDLEHTTAPLATVTAPPVAAGAIDTAPLLHHLELLLAWVGDGCLVPGAGHNGALTIAAAAPLVGGRAVTQIGRPRTDLPEEPLLERAWRALVAVRFLLPRGARARTSAAGRRWLAATGADRGRGDVALVRAYVIGVLQERRPRPQPRWLPEDVAQPDDPRDPAAAAPLADASRLEQRWDAQGWDEQLGERTTGAEEGWWQEDWGWVSSSDDDCGCTPCQVTREEARRRVERETQLDLATALAHLCRGGELSAQDQQPSGADGVLPWSRLDGVGEVGLLLQAGLLHQRSTDGPVHLEDALVPAVRSGVRRWARSCGARPPL